MIVNDLTSTILDIHGKNLKGIVVFGSLARTEDFSPLSDINIAVIVEEPASFNQKLETLFALGEKAAPIFLTFRQLKELHREGDFIAHLLSMDGKLLFGDEEVYNLLRKKPRISEKTLGYLRLYSLSTLGIAIENYFAERYAFSLLYAYRSFRSCVRYHAAKHANFIPFADKDVEYYLSKIDKQLARKYRRIRSERFTGFNVTELPSRLQDTLNSTAKLLGLETCSLIKLIDFVSRNSVKFIEKVHVKAKGQRLVMEVRYLDKDSSVKIVKI
ncbi:MAG: hypothetical protein DRJ35_06235 [Thermoprotei archaeon]|nr:MAG: hypothetical protein DRJ35_06235 [Thermoprotei archaeon]